MSLMQRLVTTNQHSRFESFLDRRFLRSQCVQQFWNGTVGRQCGGNTDQLLLSSDIVFAYPGRKYLFPAFPATCSIRDEENDSEEFNIGQDAELAHGLDVRPGAPQESLYEPFPVSPNLVVGLFTRLPEWHRLGFVRGSEHWKC